MKKLFLLVLLCLCMCVSLYSESNTYFDNFFNSHMLIKSNLNKNFNQIQEHSRDLDYIHKMYLYDEFEKNALSPVLLNLLIPFGVGSFMNDDNIGGWIIFAGDLISTTLITYAYFDMYGYFEDYDYYDDYYSYNNMEKAETLMIIGGIVYLVNIVIKIARPIAFTHRYNSRLQEALNINDDVHLSFHTALDLTSTGDLQPTVSLKFSY